MPIRQHPNGAKSFYGKLTWQEQCEWDALLKGKTIAPLAIPAGFLKNPTATVTLRHREAAPTQPLPGVPLSRTSGHGPTDH